MLALGTLLAAGNAAHATTPLTFRLDGDHQVSVGVFDSRGRLVRTLLRGRPLHAGSHTLAWDDRDDHGRPLPATTLNAQGQTVAARYEARVLQSNLTYTWEGVIGNTSASFTGPGVFRAFLPPSSLTASSSAVYFTTGYNELQPMGQGFAMSAPGTQILPLTQAATQSAGNSSQFVSMEMAATDGTNMYWANTGNAQLGTSLTGGVLPFTSFVAVSNLQNGAFDAFPAGQPVCLDYWNLTSCYTSSQFNSVIDLQQGNPTWQPTGIAVQSNGTYLAVEHATAMDAAGQVAQGNVTIYDKGTGAWLAAFPVPTLPMAAHPQNQIAFDAAGNLWVVNGTTVQCFTNLKAPGGPTLVSTITGLTRPLAIAASPNLPVTVLVADGGSSQMVKAFNASGRPTWTYGRKGGYQASPAVTANKLSFTYGRSFGTMAVTDLAGLAMLQDGSFWVIDAGNSRLLHISNQQAYLEQVAYRPANYSASVDAAQPNRVFSNFLEYNVDTSKPLQPGTPASGPSWTLVRNWQDSLPAASNVTGSGQMEGFNTVVTVGGHTYALANAGGGQGPDSEIFELPASGPARDTGLHMSASSACPLPAGTPAQDQPTQCVMYENGDLGYALGPSSDLPAQTVYRLAFDGLAANGNPQWRPPVAVASVTASVADLGHPFFHMYVGTLVGPRFPMIPAPASVSSTGAPEVVFFDPTVANQCNNGSPWCNNGNHLGGALAGNPAFAWESSPTGPIDFSQPDGSFETDAVQQQLCNMQPTLQYGGTNVWAVGNSIAFGYRGEGMVAVIPYQGYNCGNIGEANQVMHFSSDGLFLGEFGAPGFQGVDDPTFATVAGQAGNALSNALVARGKNTLYWYSSDENGHGGLHRWRIDNVQSIAVQSATGTLGQPLNVGASR